jgi:ligand-binding sensor domain-containing protein
LKYLFSFFLIITIGNSQSRIGDFKSVSSFLDVKSISLYDSLLFGVSESGLIALNTVDESIEVFSIDKGLAHAGLNEIHRDTKKNLWIGSDNGIQIWDPNKNSLVSQFDLDIEELSGFVNYDDFIYCAAKINNTWGLIEFRYVNEKIYFRDFYQRSDLKSIHKITFFNDRIFILSTNGILAGNPFQAHISTWSNPFDQVEESIIDFQVSDDALYLLTFNTIYRSSYDLNLSIIKDDYDFTSLKGIAAFNDNIFLFSGTSIFQVMKKEVQMLYYDNNLEINTLIADSNFLWAGTNYGFGSYANGIFENHAHNQPLINDPDIVDLYQNKLIIVNKNGISIEGWENFSISAPPKLISNNFKISVLPYNLGTKVTKSFVRDNLLFLSFNKSQTVGAISIDLTKKQLPIVARYYPYTNRDSSSLNYSIKDMIFDRKNNLWAISSNNSNYPLSVFSSNQSRYFSNDLPQNKIIDGNKPLAVDNYNRIWMSSHSGLLVYSYDGEIISPQDETWLSVPLIEGVNRGALNYSVSNNNTLWILTRYGLIFKKLRAQADQPVVNTGPLTSSGNITPFFQNVPFNENSKIYFDPKGNIWVTSSSSGFFVLDINNEYWPSKDGINTSNSNLLSNNIADIKFNSREGLAYIATDLGVSKFKIPFINDIKITNSVTIFPSPFKIPSNKPMVIDGISQNSTIQIMTLSGSKIKTISKQKINGYQATWNGMNDAGAYVGSGVYLVLIIDREYNTSSIEKIAIIKN